MPVFPSSKRATQICCALLFFASSGASIAAGFECPEIGKGEVRISPVQAKVFTEGNSADLANEITSLIVSLKSQRPGIDYSSILNAAMAAYCPVIADAKNLSTQEKSSRIWKFEAVLRERLASQISSGGDSSILAQVDISPKVYEALRDKAASLGQTPSKYMAALLDKAASDAGQ
ncbi:hypothetical protein Rvan_3117 [Rhodomicrobium vannielii ATCC 17100]|uniref:Uncharacterized protein n=1 Tax=Rhodomicrobium vannielii (strain ATCC 17100 / DSM 162 / LMG 4299 / NCIMB 10020 / ATH 3.1.1) TaxID=648757 RepID=E3I0Z6_RHOVT|nr:hypothetical protein [Rhodomicrobium vannielii]ADP72319.1 hypothetical protein Rvan_3117 [Rhodomicrobium vannielii ATCC 17100]